MASLLTPRSKRRTVYSDIPDSFALSPVNSDLTRVTDELSVRQSIKNLMLTDRGERLFQRDLGSDVKALLFENANPAGFKIIQNHIKDLLKIKEPRCNVIDVTISSMLDSNQIEITLRYSIINITQIQEFSVILDRVR